MTVVLALLCAITLSSADCRRDTAIDVMILGHADNEIVCALGAQMTLAQLAIVAGDGFRWVIRCEAPTSIGRGNVG